MAFVFSLLHILFCFTLLRFEKPTDIFSLGIIMVELLAEVLTEPLELTPDAQLEQQPPFDGERWKSVPANIRELIMRMLSYVCFRFSSYPLL
jgi:hypothetical protein